jgi:uncharacterized membrane protein YbhN (UPF0104 family)
VVAVRERQVQEVSRQELALPAELDRRRVRGRLIALVGLVVVVILAVTLLPGLGSLRDRLEQASPAWLAAGVLLKYLSGLGYVAAFREVFCRQMSWRVSYQIGMSELAANALLPTGGAGGLALGAWALSRGGVPGSRIARRTVAFFLLTSLPNVLALIFVGVTLAIGLLPGQASLPLELVPAGVAAGAIMVVLGLGRLADRLRARAETRHGSAARRVRFLAALSDGVAESLALLREHRPLLLLGLAAYLGFDVMVLWATFHAFGATLPLAIIWIAYLIGELGGLIPVPGGIGGVDLGLVGALLLYGAPLTAATAAVLLYRAIALWVPAVVGGAAFIGLRRTLRGEAHEIATCGPDAEMEVIGRGRVRIAGATEVSTPAR